MRNNTTIMDPLIKVSNKLNDISKTPKDFGTGDLLYASEIHTIAAIGKNPEYNLTQIADVLGVSKSAVSKFVNKLLDKDLITKRRAVDNKREVVFNLTDKGKVAFQGHEVFKEKRFKTVNEIIEKTKAEDIAMIENFLNELNEALS